MTWSIWSFFVGVSELVGLVACASFTAVGHYVSNCPFQEHGSIRKYRSGVPRWV